MPTKDGKVTILEKWEGGFGQVDPYEIHLLQSMWQQDLHKQAGNLELEMASFLGGGFWRRGVTVFGGGSPHKTHLLPLEYISPLAY
jgi:hypothetical protein